MFNNEKGSITWFDCNYRLPPIKDETELGTYSEQVLVSDGINVTKSQYVRTIKAQPIGWFGANILGFVPTHWAYINLPEIN